MAPRVPELGKAVEQDDRRTLACLDIVELDAAIDLDVSFAKTELLGQRGHRRRGRPARRRDRVRLGRSRAAKGSDDDLGVEELRRLPDHVEDAGERVCDDPVGHRGVVDPIEVLVHHPSDGARSPTDRRRIAEVLACGKDPRGRERLRQPSLELLRRCLVHQPSTEHERVLPGDGHALAVDRVEAARRVAGDDETVGPGPEPVVMPEPVLRPTIRRRSSRPAPHRGWPRRAAAFEGFARTT